MPEQFKLVNDGHALSYASPERPYLPSWAIWKNEAYGTSYEPVVFVYNTRQLPAELIPSAHADFARILNGHRDLLRGRVASYDIEHSGSGGYAVGAIEVPRGPALYLALEDTKKRLQDRVRKLQGGDPIPAGVTLATAWPRFDMGGIIKLERWLKANAGARLVVIDVLAKVRQPRSKHGDIYAEDYAVMSPLKDLADRYHCAIVVIHHTRKATAEDVFDEIRDSSGLTGACDAVMVLQRARGESDGTLHLTGRDVEEKAFGLGFDSDTCLWVMQGDAEDVKQSRERADVLRALRELGPSGPSDIAAFLEGNPVNVRSMLVKMVAAGQIRSPTRGIYALNHV